MNADALRTELVWLGFDVRNWRALALLPLVDVAWADGAVQPEERVVIQAVAKDRYRLEPEGMSLLAGWLTHRPSPDYTHRGRRALMALAQTSSPLTVATPADVLALCEQVANAAGGVFGFRKIEAAERAALVAIAEGMCIENATAWDAVFSDTDEDTAVVDRSVLLDLQAPTPLPTATRGSRAQISWVCMDVETRTEVGDAVTIGRDRTNRLQIAYDAAVSRNHCVIRRENAGWTLFDLDSQNGTRVNGERVVRRSLLGGEHIAVGGEELRFQVLA